MSDFITSPAGDILFLAINKPVAKTKKSTDLVYTIKLAFDSKKDKDFLDTISGINDAKVVTSSTYRGKDENMKKVLSTGKSVVSASSKFKPECYDDKGNILEECPFFFKDSTGTAKMIVKPYTSDVGGTINLFGVKIISLNTPKKEGVDREARLAQLRAVAAQE